MPTNTHHQRFLSTFAVPLHLRATWERPQLVSQDEAAHRLGVSRTTIWRLISAKELRSVRIGARTLVVNESLDTYVSHHSTDGGKS
ncbi:MAG: Helix-turn-helix domain [Microbacterium sp.]|jgi:excisionase family DNA binding protein|nr:Helix-turn-helix domain [Microbacterium sp.]